MTTQEKAQIAADWFEYATRPAWATRPNEGFVRVKDDAPDWVKRLVYLAHGGGESGGALLPDDWRYATIANALEWIRDNDNPDGGEFADDTVDVYTGERLAWLGSNLRRPGYVDEAVEERGAPNPDGIIERIGLGQYAEALEVFGLVLEALEAAEVLEEVA